MKQNNSNSNKIQKQTGEHAEHKVPQAEAGGCGIKVSAV